MKTTITAMFIIMFALNNNILSRKFFLQYIVGYIFIYKHSVLVVFEMIETLNLIATHLKRKIMDYSINK